MTASSKSTNLPSAEERRKKAMALLQSWLEEDDGEHKETDNDLMRMLDEDRLSDRQLFPHEFQGITW